MGSQIISSEISLTDDNPSLQMEARPRAPNSTKHTSGG